MSVTQISHQQSEVMSQNQALEMNTVASNALRELVAPSLGPRGATKMVVGGAGQIKLLKDGGDLLNSIPLAQPTVVMIARNATAMDDTTGDGTISVIILVCELLHRCSEIIREGLHPRACANGIELAAAEAMKFLESYKQDGMDDEKLYQVALSSIQTKLDAKLSEQFAKIVVEAVKIVKREDQPIDLHMVERMHIVQLFAQDSRLVRGLVMDHGRRHPDMPSHLENAHVLTLNVSLEYEKSEYDAKMVFSTAEEREKMVESERRFVDDKVRKIIEFKRHVCKPDEEGKVKNFFICNQKGIDPLSLDMLAKEGILAIRRAKRRNMERVPLACGGVCVNSVDDLDESILGYAGAISELTLGDNKYTTIEDVRHPHSCTVLIKGPNEHTIAQIKGAVRDGLRAVKNAMEANALVPGGAAFELDLHKHLMEYAKTVSGKAKLGIISFAESLLAIPKQLAANSGFDVQDTLIKLQDSLGEKSVGLDVYSGECMTPEDHGVWDNVVVKGQMIQLARTLTPQLLLVDEVMRCGRGSRGKPQQ
eukprot:TRINITY_DN1937_c0_g1_i1.p1 TRINITY_DN1937_c0_g1~~TRINITY_DN1937_c0_g1_i1.p1  ORF type:complete len:553 (+),score=199.66 TRINITY_DN1937_c0_g1_i1:54-1661(+)